MWVYVKCFSMQLRRSNSAIYGPTRVAAPRRPDSTTPPLQTLHRPGRCLSLSQDQEHRHDVGHGRRLHVRRWGRLRPGIYAFWVKTLKQLDLCGNWTVVWLVSLLANVSSLANQRCLALAAEQLFVSLQHQHYTALTLTLSCCLLPATSLTCHWI